MLEFTTMVNKDARRPRTIGAARLSASGSYAFQHHQDLIIHEVSKWGVDSANAQGRLVEPLVPTGTGSATIWWLNESTKCRPFRR